MLIYFYTFCYVFVNISAKNAARIKIKDSFAIFMNWAYQKCRLSGSCEINKKQSGNSFAGHPVKELNNFMPKNLSFVTLKGGKVKLIM